MRKYAYPAAVIAATGAVQRVGSHAYDVVSGMARGAHRNGRKHSRDFNRVSPPPYGGPPRKKVQMSQGPNGGGGVYGVVPGSSRAIGAKSVRSNNTGNIGSALRGKKIRKTRARKFSKRGLLFQKKVGGATSSDNTLYLGHCSAPMNVVVNQAWMTAVKELMLRAGCDVSSVDSVLPYTVIGDTIIVQYTQREGSTLSSTTFTFGAAETLQTVSSWMTSIARPWGAESGSDSDQYTFHSFKFIPAGGARATDPLNGALIMLKDMTVKLDCKSNFKMQNRTIGTSLNVEADDVDNVPLFGDMYEGRGNGAIYIKPAGAAGAVPTFVCDIDNGTLKLEPGASYNAPAFLPDATQFVGVSKAAGFNLLPGQIRNSTLSTLVSMKFNDLFLATHPKGAGLSYNIRKKMGQFRFFAIQKKIHYAAADTEIQTVYELEMNIASTVSFRRQYQSTTYFVQVLDQNI